MTIRTSALARTIAAARRWWIVTLVGLFVTMGATATVYRRPAVYYTKTVVLLSEPVDPGDNPLISGPGGVVMTASVIQRMMGGPNHTRTVSNDIRLVDTGVRNGWSIRLWNSGGQWTNYFDRPELTIEVVGPVAAQVAARDTALVNQARVLLTRLQDREQLPSDRRITARVLSSDGAPYRVGGQPKKAAGMAMAIGLAGTVSLVNLLDGRRWRKRETTSPADDVSALRETAAAQA